MHTYTTTIKDLLGELGMEVKGEGTGNENMGEWDAQFGRRMEKESNERDIFNRGNHYGVRDKTGARETPRKS